MKALLLISFLFSYTLHATPQSFSGVIGKDASQPFSDLQVRWYRHGEEDFGNASTLLRIKSKGVEFIGCDLRIELARQDYPYKKYSSKVYTYPKVNILQGRNKFRYADLENIELPFRGRLSLEGCEFFRPKEMMAAELPLASEIDHSIEGLVRYLDETQEKTTFGQDILAGEWGSRMVLRETNKVIEWSLGELGKDKYDSNCFETTATHNLLAELYLKYGENIPDFERIPPVLELAINKAMRCKGEEGFGFWPEIDMPAKWLEKHPDAPKKIRSPNHFDYKKYFAQLMSHNVDDTDDTSMTYLALKLNKEVMYQSGRPFHLDDEIPEKIGPKFSKYRSPRRTKNRKGVFQTWMGEKSDKFMAFYDGDKVIPLDKNVVDCVVVANILATLGAYGELAPTKGVAKSCSYVNKRVTKGKQFKCGAYYPNRFNLHFAVSKAISNGATCLEESVPTLMEDIETLQNNDGSWNTYDEENDDIYQSTAYALGAYLTFVENKGVGLSSYGEDLVTRGMQFALRTKRLSGNHVFWPAGNHFSGGPLLGLSGLRHMLVWKSRGYINALMLQNLIEAKKYLY